jgi:hypothetical protein
MMTVPQPLDKIGDLARRVQGPGFSSRLFTKTGRTAYLNAAVASQAAPGLELSTGVAVAFPRSPFVTAATAWELSLCGQVPKPADWVRDPGSAHRHGILTRRADLYSRCIAV